MTHDHHAHDGYNILSDDGGFLDFCRLKVAIG